MKSPSILVVGPISSKGGITSVIRAHSQLYMWRSFNCKALNTFSDAGPWTKLRTALIAYLLAPFLLFRASAVHAHIAGFSSMARKLPIFILARILRRPILVHVHAPHPTWILAGQGHLLFRIICGLADGIIVLSKWWEAQLKGAQVATPIHVVPNPIVFSGLDNTRRSDGTRVLYAGKLEPRKGYADLIQAAARVLRTVPQTEFVFAGHGELQRAARLADQIGIGRSVRFVGWIEGDQLANLYRTSDVFCLPSYSEGVPMSLLEAMSWALPVVTTPVGGIPDIVVHDQNGLFAEPGDVDQLAHQLEYLLNDESKRKNLGDAARTSVLRLCGADLVSRQITEIYQDLLMGRITPARLSRPSLPINTNSIRPL